MKGRWLKIDSDMSIVKVKCFSEAPKHTSQKILVELRQVACLFPCFDGGEGVVFINKMIIQVKLLLNSEIQAFMLPRSGLNVCGGGTLRDIGGPLKLRAPAF